MTPTQHPSNNTVLRPPPGATPEECRPLAITRVHYPDGTPGVQSYWLPSDAERRAIAEGKMVRLSIQGVTHAPLWVDVAGVDAEPAPPAVDVVMVSRDELEQLRAAARHAGDPAVDRFLEEVRTELTRARTKFPGDRLMTIALAEEFGELCKAVLDESGANVRKEAVQTAVMACRVAIDGDSSVGDWRDGKGLDDMTSEARRGL